MSIVGKLVSTIIPKSLEERRADAYRQVIREHAKVGGRLFGPIPKGTRREFFCLDERTWVWHEEWTDELGKYQIRTTRYDVRPNGVFKAQDGQPYRPIELEEARRFMYAVSHYNEAIDTELLKLVA